MLILDLKMSKLQKPGFSQVSLAACGRANRLNGFTFIFQPHTWLKPGVNESRTRYEHSKLNSRNPDKANRK